MLSVLVLSLALSQAPTAGLVPGTESDESRLHGFDLGLTVFNSSGVYFGEGGYSNSFTFWLEPSFAIGRTFFKGTWFERLSIGARIPFGVQVAGNDPTYSGTTYGEGPMFAYPEQAPIADVQREGARLSAKPVSRGIAMNDVWLTLAHGHLLTIPVLGVEVAGSLRSAFPTSIASRSAGFLSSIGLALLFERKFFDGRLDVGYMVRPTKYFYSQTTGGYTHLNTPVQVNGRDETPLTHDSTGYANPSFLIVNGFFASLDIVYGFGVSLNYFLFNTKPYDVVGGCDAANVALSNLCTDGALVGGVSKTPWRNDHYFLASVDYHQSFWSLSLGLSTYRAMENPDGTRSQPFFVSNRNNATTVYLSFSANAEGVAAWAIGSKDKQ